MAEKYTMKEAELQSAIIELLEYYENRGVLMFNRLNNIPPPQKDIKGNLAFRKMPKGAKKGLPDIIIHSRGKTIYLELKSDTGKQSKEQAAWQAACQKQNVGYFVARKIEIVEELIRMLEKMD